MRRPANVEVPHEYVYCSDLDDLKQMPEEPESGYSDRCTVLGAAPLNDSREDVYDDRERRDTITAEDEKREKEISESQEVKQVGQKFREFVI